MEPFFAEVDKLDGVKVVSPYSPRAPTFNSKAKPISFAQLSVTQRSQGATIKLADKIQALGDRSCVHQDWRSSTAASCSPGSSCPRARSSASSPP